MISADRPDGLVLDVLVQSWRNKAKAGRLLGKLLKKQMRPPRVTITDELASYQALKKDPLPDAEHRQHKGLNNRAEHHINQHGDENGR